MAKYYRVGTEGSNLEFSITPGVKALLFINAVVFVVFSYVAGAVLWLGLVPARFVRGAIWQLLTYQFMHADFWHILFNMLTLWMFGTAIESVWGTRRFVRFFLMCGAGAGVCVVLGAYLLGGSFEQNIPTVGASGAIFGILMAYGIMFPNNLIWMFFLFRVPARYAVMIWGGIEFFGFTHASGAVSHIAHLGGLLTGYLLLRYEGFSSMSYGRRRSGGWQSLTSWFSLDSWRYRYEDWNRRRLRKKFAVYMKKRGGDDDQTIH